MATKKATKKVVKAEKVIKPHKNEVKLPLPEPKPRAKKKEKVINVEAKVELVTFEIAAVIPTQQYGNIQPKITVTAPSIEMARDTVMPILCEMYQQYAEAPLNGKPLKFLGKITTKEKVVDVPNPEPVAPTPAPEKAVEAEKAPEVAQDATGAVESAEPTVERSEPFKKAEKAISLAMTQDAIDVISEQIKKSVKIAEDDKPVLYTQILKKQKEFEPK